MDFKMIVIGDKVFTTKELMTTKDGYTFEIVKSDKVYGPNCETGFCFGLTTYWIKINDEWKSMGIKTIDELAREKIYEKTYEEYINEMS